MQLTTTELRSVDQTVAEMFRLVNLYYGDVARFATMTPEAFYNKVRAIPYRADPRGNEFLQRPASTLNGWSECGDCDDKAIVMAAYAKAAGIEYRIAIGGSQAVRVGSRVEYPFHHVWAEFKMMGKWVPMDATYPRYQPYMHNQSYKRVKFYYPKVP